MVQNDVPARSAGKRGTASAPTGTLLDQAGHRDAPAGLPAPSAGRHGVPATAASAITRRLPTKSCWPLISPARMNSMINEATPRANPPVQCVPPPASTRPAAWQTRPGMLGWPDARADWNRPGYDAVWPIALPRSPHPEADKLQPVMTFTVRSYRSCARCPQAKAVGYGSRLARPSVSSRIATIPVGLRGRLPPAGR